MLRVTAWRLRRWWQRRQRDRWMMRYARAVAWHSDYSWFHAYAMAESALLDDPVALTERDPIDAALHDLGICTEDLA